MGEKQVVLTEKEAHCIARLLQGVIFADEDGNGGLLSTCEFCKFKCLKQDDRHHLSMPHFTAIRKKLEQETGVDLGPMLYGNLLGWPPYKKFLKNSSDETKEFFRNFFSDI